MANKKILALTACPVGIAHTYIAQEKLETAAKSLRYDIKVETHGSIGLKNEINATDVADADLIIIAVAAGASDLRLERFNGKPLYQVEITKVIKNPEGIIKEAFEHAKPYESKEKLNTTNNNSQSNDIFATNKTGIMKHIMSGVGYMVPFVVFGGIMIAISLGLSQAIYGPGVQPAKPEFLWYMLQAGTVGFTLMIPILAGFIANSIAGRAALVPAMVSAFIANSPDLYYQIGNIKVDTPAGFLGALLIGPVVGYLVKWIITWKVPKVIAPVMPIFFIPIAVTFIVSFTFIYGIGAPIGWVMEQFKYGITKLPNYAMAGIGLLLGAMVGFDMGGPINKVAFLAAAGILAGGNGDPNTQIFMGAVAAGIPVAPIGMGLTTLIFRKYFNEAERGLGITALILGCIGISEGAIPFAIRDPKRAIIANIIGSAVAGCIAGAFFLTDAAAHGGPIVAILGAVGALHYSKGIGILLFFVAIVAGSCVTCFLYGGLLIIQERQIKVFQVISKKFSKKTKNEKNKSVTETEIKNEKNKSVVEDTKKKPQKPHNTANKKIAINSYNFNY